MNLILKYQLKRMSLNNWLKNDDPEVLLDELKHKQRIARIIRETKEVGL